MMLALIGHTIGLRVPARSQPSVRTRGRLLCTDAAGVCTESAHDAAGVPTEWHASHHGADRVVWRRNTADWLTERAEPLLPSTFNIVSGLPDISEVRPRVSAEDYEEWCADVIQSMLELLPPEQVAIFYQTPGRYSGACGTWLDKGYLCQLGARRAGAACVWQKVVLFQDSVDRVRGGTRPGFINMLCFSKRHRGAHD